MRAKKPRRKGRWRAEGRRGMRRREESEKKEKIAKNGLEKEEKTAKEPPMLDDKPITPPTFKPRKT